MGSSIISGPVVPVLIDGCVHHLFEQQVIRTPDAIAVCDEDEQLTYRELNERANRLSDYLRGLGVGPDKLVGVFLERSASILVALLGTLKAGAAYVPLDPIYPPERIAFVLEDAGAPILLTQQNLLRELKPMSARLICLDRDWPEIGRKKTDNPQFKMSSDQLAYVIYTSGSTGKPKGVQIEHRALVNFLVSMQREPGLNDRDVVLAVTTLSFDIAGLELFLPLISGARVVIVHWQTTVDGAALTRMIENHNVSVMQATPATWRLLLEAGWQGSPNLKVLCGGEPLSKDLARQLLPRCRELWNMYGPTETTIWSTCSRVTDPDDVHIGRPIDNTDLYILDEQMQPLPVGIPGELLIGGEGLARGYFHRPELTAEKFIVHPFKPRSRLYRTGDVARCRPDGNLDCLGRLDDQVKIRGYRIELGEIEAVLRQHPQVKQAVVTAREDAPGEKRLVAYLVTREASSADADNLRELLHAQLPDYMIPATFVTLEKIPLTPNGKIDRNALPAPQKGRPLLAQAYIAPRTVLEKQLAALWCELLQLDEIGIDDSFFDLGGTSLLVVRMANLYLSRHGREISPVKVFQYPTIAQLGHLLEGSDADSSFLEDFERRARQQRDKHSANDLSHDAVAVIGMVGRFPGADNLEKLWSNLCNSVESISFFKPEELGPGIEEHLKNDPDYIRARGIIDGADMFDAAFFGISPLEAKVMDPQQRLFLELAQQALENAGYDPDRYKGLIGIFAGVGDNHYYTTNLLTHPDLLAMAGKLAVEYGNEKDYIAPRTAYVLDLRGPAVSLNTACSTSLLTIDSAFRALLDYECDMALAGGIDISVPQKSGFLYQDGGTFAKDGHCRPFDADATGTMFCDGAGIVVLKRLADALTDGDTIYAVLLGSGKNNNGARPVSFLAPSVEGQAEVIAMAQARARVPVETIRYIEAHGTGTPVGDPIEFEALCKVFQSKTGKKQFCYLGSLKGNIGHPTNAAGVAGLIKAALVLHREQIPATLHFKKPNPKIDFANSPFIMADRLIPFPRRKEPRRVAVSSFGFGGTNVHTILEEAPAPRPGGKSRPLQILPLSAKTSSALGVYAESLARHLENLPEAEFADAAYTLQKGRKQMAQRRFVVAADSQEAARYLRQSNPLRCGSNCCERRDPPVVFLFGGQGTQYVNMGHNLYHGEPLFRAVVDDCCDFLKPYLGRDLRELLYPRDDDVETARISLQNTFFTQPSIFVIEYALARFWQSLGLRPAMMAGHSIGEFVAATLAGVWDLQDALRIIALRGQLMQQLPRGCMLAVGSSADQVEKMLPASVQIASNNAPSLCVVSGPEEDVAALKESLEGQNIVCRHLHTSHAFHSAMMDPMVEPLRAEVDKVRLKVPTQPFVSTVTGQPITDEQATDPAYWARHSRATVQFSKAVQWLLEHQYDLFLECGPRSTLSSLVRKHITLHRSGTAIPTLGDTHENNAEWAAMLFAIGSLWQNGIAIDWDAFYAHEDRRRIPLPTYPFERQRYWVDPAPAFAAAASSPVQADALSLERAVVEQPGAVPIPSPTAAQAGTAETRKDRLVARLIEILVPVFGRESSQISASATFLEQGFDSLSLTQVSFAIRKEFGVKVSFSQLMNLLPNIDIVAEHLDTTLAPNLFAGSSPVKSIDTVPTGGATLPAAAAPPAMAALEAVIAQQARNIDRLISLLEAVSPAQIPAAVSSAGGASLISQAKGSEPGQTSDTPAAQIAVVSARTDTIALPITAGQQEIWFASQLGDNTSRAFNQLVLIRLRGNLHLRALELSIQELVARHDSLRTTFSAGGDQQYIHAMRAQDLPVIDLSGIGETEREGRIQQEMDRLNRTIFDLVLGPLMKVQLLRLNDHDHLLHLAFHHIVVDGWSAHVIVTELSQIYSAIVSGAPRDLGPSMQYRDYVDWYHQAGTVEQRAADEAFWLQSLADRPEAVELPTTGVRPMKRSYRAGNASLVIDGEMYGRLKKTSAELNCTFFHFLLGTFNVWLHRVTRQDDIVVGVPMAGHLAANLQQIRGCENLVGHCANLVPIRSRMRGDLRFDDCLRALKDQMLTARAHEGVTYGELLNQLDLPRDSSRVPLISVTLNLNDDPQTQWTGLEVAVETPPRPFVFFDLEINIYETSDGMGVVCYFADDLFDSATVVRWLSQWRTLMASAADEPGQRLDELEILGPTERERLLVEWNRTEQEFAGPERLHELIGCQAEITPEAVAVEFEGRSLTYRELDRRSNQVARYLKNLGVGPNVLVGLFHERSLDMMVSLMGILKAGGAYVPLDPSFPEDRLCYMVKNSGMRVLVTHSDLDGKLPMRPESVVRLDRDWEQIAQQSGDRIGEEEGGGKDLAYVLYTSGSTGKPKGVEIEHRAIVNLLLSMQREPGFTAKDTMLAVTTLSFDIAGLELYLPLICGGRVVIASREDTHDPVRLMKRMQESRCTVMQATPATWRALIDAGWSGSRNLKILCGGESFPPDLAEKLLERCRELWNMYGPTETTVWSTIWNVESVKGAIPIGRPIANTKLYVLDENGNLVPVGVVGELYIGGTGVARGYLQQGELTRERFVENRFEVGSGRLYRTGDLARWLPDGRMECLGRLDHQVKIRGFRIELEEVEAVLSRHEAVGQCVVAAREDTPGEKMLVAYLETKGGAEPAIGDLRAHLSRDLPDYMIPSAFVVMEKLPLTPNNKIDRRALPAPGAQSAATAKEFLEPRDLLEQSLAKIWSKVLRVKRVGLRDNFFDLGGHSLNAVILISEIKKLTGKSLPLATLFQAATVEAFADILRRDGWAPSWSSLVSIQPRGSKNPLFLVHGAEGNVLLYRQMTRYLGPDQPVYGLQSQGLNGDGNLKTTIPDMAAEYVQEILTMQPEGPYFLGGYCLGGTIAYEMAQQLTAMGKKVELVVMLDTYNYTRVSAATAMLRAPVHLFQNLWFHGANFLSLPAKDRQNFLKEKVDIASGRIGIRLRAASSAIRGLGSRKTHASFPHLMIKRINDQAMEQYVPRPYSGRVAIIRSRCGFTGEGSPTYGWGEFVHEGLEIHQLPIYPKGMLIEPFCSVLAETLKLCLQKA